MTDPIDATIAAAPHDLLEAGAFLTAFDAPLAERPSPSTLLTYFGPACAPPLATDGEVKGAVRDLLRRGGFKPTGRNKPASEYLLKAIESGWFGPDKGINLAVDACNAVSLHSGLPISVIDAELAAPPWRLAVCEPGESYVFNPSGQVIDVGGLISLRDAVGPCAGPVKDCQRTKTHDGTTRTLSVIWGTRALPGRTAATVAWYRELLEAAGATTREVAVTAAAG